MAKCDQGYICDICGREVEGITESDLYLRFVLGEVSPHILHVTPERHIRCNPALAQFIVTDGFDPVPCNDVFDKSQLDADWVREQEVRITSAWQRLQDLTRDGLPLSEYPLPEVRRAWQQARNE